LILGLGWPLNKRPQQQQPQQSRSKHKTREVLLSTACVEMSGKSPTWLSPFITGLANFATQYNFQSIAAALVVMSSSICTSDDDNCRNGIQADWVASMSTAAVFLGAVVGQCSMGFLGDYLNRSVALGITMMIASFSAMMTAIASVQANSPTSIYGTIIFFRFTLGIGVGGVYPLSATKASEDSAHVKGKVNSISASWAFFWQFPGIIAPWLLTFILTYSSSMTVGQRWRLILGFGAIPFAIAVGLVFLEIHLKGKSALESMRDTIATVETSTKDVVIQHAGPISSSDIWQLLKNDPKTRLKLFVCGGCWLLYNIYVYGLGLLASVIIEAISGDDDNISSDSAVRNVTSKQMIAMVLSIPTTIGSIYALHYFGMKRLQVFGFSAMCIMAFILAVSFYPLHAQNKGDGLFTIYCLCAVSMNVGAGITTFSLPAAFFPKRIRSTFNGFAAAIGKIGAFIGAFSFRLIAQTQGFAFVLGICTAVSLVAALISFFLIDQKLILNEDEHHDNDEKHANSEERETFGFQMAPTTSVMHNQA
jgi:PHS family inorganic phosphate transporter-like MFS transporter